MPGVSSASAPAIANPSEAFRPFASPSAFAQVERQLGRLGKAVDCALRGQVFSMEEVFDMLADCKIVGELMENDTIIDKFDAELSKVCNHLRQKGVELERQLDIYVTQATMPNAQYSAHILKKKLQPSVDVLRTMVLLKPFDDDMKRLEIANHLRGAFEAVQGALQRLLSCISDQTAKLLKPESTAVESGGSDLPVGGDNDNAVSQASDRGPATESATRLGAGQRKSCISVAVSAFARSLRLLEAAFPMASTHFSERTEELVELLQNATMGLNDTFDAAQQGLQSAATARDVESAVATACDLMFFTTCVEAIHDEADDEENVNMVAASQEPISFDDLPFDGEESDEDANENENDRARGGQASKTNAEETLFDVIEAVLPDTDMYHQHMDSAIAQFLARIKSDTDAVANSMSEHCASTNSSLAGAVNAVQHDVTALSNQYEWLRALSLAMSEKTSTAFVQEIDFDQFMQQQQRLLQIGRKTMEHFVKLVESGCQSLEQLDDAGWTLLATAVLASTQLENFLSHSAGGASNSTQKMLGQLDAAIDSVALIHIKTVVPTLKRSTKHKYLEQKVYLDLQAKLSIVARFDIVMRVRVSVPAWFVHNRLSRLPAAHAGI